MHYQRVMGQTSVQVQNAGKGFSNESVMSIDNQTCHKVNEIIGLCCIKMFVCKSKSHHMNGLFVCLQ